MPARKQTALARRISDRDLQEMRTAISVGVPYCQPALGSLDRGYPDLIFLVTGLFYRICDFIQDKNDLEAAREIWFELREDILQQHIQRRPLTRPWAFWRLEDREPLTENQDQAEYLRRHKLLLPEEKTAGRQKTRRQNGL